MKRLSTLLATLLFATTALAQSDKTDEKKPEEFNTVREYRNRVFEVRNRLPRDLYSSIVLLGSGFKGAGINVNNELSTVTVRDFPENIAAIEEAIKRLDKPVDAAADIDLRIAVLIASKTPFANAPAVPDELAPVVKQLQTTLRYSHYGLLTTSMHRTTIGRGIEGSGVADATLLGMKPDQERPIMYRYKLRNLRSATSPERTMIDVEHFEFSMSVPINVGNNIQYQNVGFETPVSLREKEKVVIGTTTMGDKALIVVVTASIADK